MQALKQLQPFPFQTAETDELKIKPLEVDTDIHESMRLAGAEDVSVEQLASAESEANQRGRQARVLCCCRRRGCGIGPFTEVEEY